MSQLTELQIQADAMRAIADLTEAAVNNGAKHTPSWNISGSGLVYGYFTFPEPPKPCEMDPWRLVIGAHAVTRNNYQSEGGLLHAEHIRVTYRDVTVHLTIAYRVSAAPMVVAA